MAILYKPADAISLAKSLVKKMPLDTTTNASLCYQIADYVSSLMWQAAPFYWTLGQLGTITLNGSAQDFALGSAAPTDFLYLHACQVTDGVNLNQVTPVAQLPLTEVQVGNPSQCAWITTSTSNAAIRFWPKPAPGEARTAVLQYKRYPAIISSNNFNTVGSAFAWPDVYYPVYQAGVNWQAYLWADDQRAGTATADNSGKVQFTGALGSFMSLLDEMRRAEKLPLVYPGQPMTRG